MSSALWSDRLLKVYLTSLISLTKARRGQGVILQAGYFSDFLCFFPANIWRGTSGQVKSAIEATLSKSASICDNRDHPDGAADAAVGPEGRGSASEQAEEPKTLTGRAIPPEPMAPGPGAPGERLVSS